MDEYGAVGGTIVAHVGTALKQELAGLARENDRSLSAEVRRAIREHLERDENEEEAA